MKESQFPKKYKSNPFDMSEYHPEIEIRLPRCRLEVKMLVNTKSEVDHLLAAVLFI